MNERPESLQIVRQWIEKAENDLIAAEHTLTLTPNCPFEIVCFHAQQCAEKYLKALLVARSIDFPKTHDLRLLNQLLPADIQLGLELTRLFVLNRYAIASRYPGDCEPFTREEAQQAVDTAKIVKAAVKPHLKLSS